MKFGSDLFDTVRWVHNKWGPRFDGVYSDGGLGMPRYNVERDLRKFVKTWKPGNRYRILLHPQYYGADHQAKGVNGADLTGVDWYEDLVAIYADGGSAWSR